MLNDYCSIAWVSLLMITYPTVPNHEVFGQPCLVAKRCNCLVAAAGLGDEERLLGGAVQRKPVQDIPENLFWVSDVQINELYPPFRKHLKSCGIILAATDKVPNQFLNRVGKVIEEIFTHRDGIDLEAQRDVVEALHAYGALLPVPRNEGSFDRLIQRDEQAFDRLHRKYSICDIIMAQVPEGQVMEVVEHILHTVTDVGLHYQFPNEWGLSRNSELWSAMQRAIDEGFYDVSSYHDLDGAPQEVVDRILMQEFAYWFITTAWDLQEMYGPEEDEWTLRTPEELKSKMPEFYGIYLRTAARVMSPPSPQSLTQIGPKRKAERRR